MRYLLWLCLNLVLAAAWVRAQPFPPPDSGDALCEEAPREDLEPDLSQPDAEGYHSLFNGVDFSGWWLNCRERGVPTNGPVVRVDQMRKAIFSSQRVSRGGVLMTKAKFSDYEIVFDYWPNWRNEAALLNRADSLGRAFNITLGYRVGVPMGGVWGEAGLFSRYLFPFQFAAIESTIAMPDSAPMLPEYSRGPSWTHITRQLKAAGEPVPCLESGCTQEDWQRLWDFDDWNQIRVTFHGGRNPGDPVHARSWFRKLTAVDWVPLHVDSGLHMEMKPGHIGLGVYGGRWVDGTGVWFRNIRWKPWTPSRPNTVGRAPSPALHRPIIRADGSRREIRIEFAETALVRDIRILSLDGRSMVELQGVRGEALLSTAGWNRGVYLLCVDAAGQRGRTRFILP